LRVQPHTWEAFVLTAVEGLSGAEAASRLGMQVGAVYVARGKVQRMLQEEVRRLEESEVTR
jgi:RNA polymerase sigma-70 factor (ECF subfamily)